MNKRFQELDSLRGLAAVTVLIHHYLLIFPIINQKTIADDSLNIINLLKYSPLHIIYSGHEAVILFFTLSGFVLALPFYNNIGLKYSDFVIKRFFRIYIPYIVAVFLAMLLRSLFYNGGIGELSVWFNAVWSQSLSWKTLIHHILLIPSFKNGFFDPVLWSLVHEMRISLIFPIIMYFILRVNWKWNLLFSFIVSYVGFKIHLKFLYTDTPNDYFKTFQYLVMFISGALIAKYKTFLINLYNKTNLSFKLFILILGMILYTSRWTFYESSLMKTLVFNDWAIMIGSVIFIIFSLSSKFLSKLLLTKPMIYLGEISYSIYLYHAIILFTLIYILYDWVPLTIILLISCFITVMISKYSYLLFELPSIKLGMLLINKKNINNSALNKTENRYKTAN
jgi:peptidoglycan/LPS O-acetylase OafA/YrhL